MTFFDFLRNLLDACGLVLVGGGAHWPPTPPALDPRLNRHARRRARAMRRRSSR